LDIAINEIQRIRKAVFGGDRPGSFAMGCAWTTATGTLMDSKPPFCRAALEKSRRAPVSFASVGPESAYQR
jgi:hypothetical protein